MVGDSCEYDLKLDILHGQLPEDLSGSYYCVGGVPHKPGAHIFAGDGMVFRLDLNARPPRLISRWVQPHEHERTRLPRFEWNMLQVEAVGAVRNLANTALYPFAGQLLVTYDGGRPYILDPLTLQTLSPVGRLEEWLSVIPHPLLPSVITSAHIGVADGNAYFCNYLTDALPVGGSETRILCWDGKADLQAWPIRGLKVRYGVHQLELTRDYVVLLDMPTPAIAGWDKIVDSACIQRIADETHVYWIRRADLTRANQKDGVPFKELRLPRENIHFAVEYDHPPGELQLYIPHNCTLNIFEKITEQDYEYYTGNLAETGIRGFLHNPTDLNVFGKYRIDAENAQLIDSQLLVDQTYGWGLNLFTPYQPYKAANGRRYLWPFASGFHCNSFTKRYAEAYRDYNHRTVPFEALPRTDVPGRLLRLRLDDLVVEDSFEFAVDETIASHQFIDQGGGYILCVVQSDRLPGDRFVLFDAMHLARGPLCEMGHSSLKMAYTIHSTYLPSVESVPLDYRIDAATDYGQNLARFPAAVLRALTGKQ